jgi:hypothetical protein
MGLWDQLVSYFRDEDKKYKKIFFNKNQTDEGYNDAPVTEGSAYCRIWLAEMRLARGVDWFKSRYPMVYAAIRYDYGNKAVTIPYVGGLDYFKALTEENLDKIIQVNRPLTPLFPFNRGVVDFQSALFSIDSSDPVAKFLSAMGKLSKLIPVPELSLVMGLVEPIYSGIEDLIGAGKSKFELGYQRAFVGAEEGALGSNFLRQGYFAAILAEDQDFKDEHLRVEDDSLKLVNGATGVSQELAGYNYMLFRIEVRSQQDWESLSSIKALVERAESALESGKPGVAKDLLISIKVAIARSPDVTKGDRQGMFARISAHLSSLGLEGRLGTLAKRSLYEIMQQPSPSLDEGTKKELEQLHELFTS